VDPGLDLASDPSACSQRASVTATTGQSWSGAPSGDAQPVAVRVDEGALAPGESVFVDGDPELLRNGVDVVDLQVDQGVRSSVALVLRQV
jgi:hypothetical protein